MADQFWKQLKISYGKTSGEARLVIMGEVQNRNIALQDIVADYSKEEFIILMKPDSCQALPMKTVIIR